jgi:hypothetical protein
MGWFRKGASGKRGKDIAEYVQSPDVSPSAASEVKKSGRLNTKSERLALVQDNCEQIIENLRQIEEAKVEYQAVTSYLTDMQKIDMIPREQRATLEDAARRILNLNKEREKYREKNTNITDGQYRLFERYEIQLPREMEAIKESERYQVVIQKDLDQLDQEKQNLLSEEEDIFNKHAFLKGIAITTCVIVVLLFGVFAALASFTGTNLTMPFLLTVLMGMVSAFYIFMEARKNLYDIKVVELKQNRQVILMNKVKLKSVNNRNYLDYTYNKYMVENYNELKVCWEEYVKVKDETRRYQNNTELLKFYNNELIHELKKFQIADSEIWIYQPTAILDNREMVEVRHRLNIRRQKLRERIALNSKQKEEAVETISSIVKNYPDCEEEATMILKRYKVQ